MSVRFPLKHTFVCQRVSQTNDQYHSDSEVSSPLLCSQSSIKRVLRVYTEYVAAQGDKFFTWFWPRSGWLGFCHRPHLYTSGGGCCNSSNLGAQITSASSLTCSVVVSWGGRPVPSPSSPCPYPRPCTSPVQQLMCFRYMLRNLTTKFRIPFSYDVKSKYISEVDSFCLIAAASFKVQLCSLFMKQWMKAKQVLW